MKKYYWISIVKQRTTYDEYFDYTIDEHPFNHVINQEKFDRKQKIALKINLLNYKEITKEEYDFYNDHF